MTPIEIVAQDPILDGLSSRRAFVTGGASGIGLAVAQELARSGVSVTAADRDEHALTLLPPALAETAVVLDLADTAAVAAVDLDTDILVNCAGFQHVAPVEDFPTDLFRSMVRVMLEAPFVLCQQALPGMYRRGWGRLVHITSAHGHRGSPYKSAYVSAKHGLEGLSKVLSAEGAAHGVTSNTISPGYVRTPLVENQIVAQAAAHGISEDQVLEQVLLAREPVKRLIEPAEVAALVVMLCGPGSDSITGSTLSIDGGWTAT